MMRYGVMEFRFPQEALLSDMKSIFARGVHFRGGKVFGRDETFSSFAQEGFDAVLVAVGTREAVRLPGAGDEDQGFHDALSFLSRIRKGRPPYLHRHRRVVVIGGGNVAVDVARASLRMGVPDVTIVCLESERRCPPSLGSRGCGRRRRSSS
jgi:NADPH-dependent glutamate synthase beta subunit-like oxidoreductase